MTGKVWRYTLTKIIRILPAMPQLTIMLLNNHLQEPIQKTLTLIRCKFIDTLAVIANCKETFPACHGVGTDDWMSCCERITHVVWGSSWLGI